MDARDADDIRVPSEERKQRREKRREARAEERSTGLGFDLRVLEHLNAIQLALNQIAESTQALARMR